MQFEAWADDEDDWDRETGAPGIALFGRALQVWAVMQPGDVVTVAAAAAAFDVPARRIVEAVEEHPGMFLTGAGETPAIEHEGE